MGYVCVVCQQKSVSAGKYLCGECSKTYSESEPWLAEEIRVEKDRRQQNRRDIGAGVKPMTFADVKPERLERATTRLEKRMPEDPNDCFGQRYGLRPIRCGKCRKASECAEVWSTREWHTTGAGCADAEVDDSHNSLVAA